MVFSWRMSVVLLALLGCKTAESTLESNSSSSSTAEYSLFCTNKDQKKLEVLKKSPSRFNENKLTSEQLFATSADGTAIPYFIVHPKNWKKDGKNPTLLAGYGGFEVSMQPYFLNSAGKVWSEKGGVYVLANIRGGGEFGAAWHQAAPSRGPCSALLIWIKVLFTQTPTMAFERSVIFT